MSALPSIFLDNLLPIFLIASSGYLLGRWLDVQPESLSKVVFNIFAPFLLFKLLTENSLSNGDFVQMMAFALLNVLILGGITWLIGKLFKLERRLLSAVLLTTVLMNAGNYGLSLNLFAFGEKGLAYASIFFITSAILTYTLGVMIASMGSESLGRSLLGLLKIPAIYAVILAVVFIYFRWDLPLPLERTTSFLADAAIPALLVVLGLQLQKSPKITYSNALVLAICMRLLGGAFLALGLSRVFNMGGVAYQAGVVEASMPSAVMSTILATEYDVKPAFVTSVVFFTTLLSPLTLTPLLAFLGA